MSHAALNTQFDLPSPPARTIFSTAQQESGRAWFPDFTVTQDPVASLHDFISILFYPSLPTRTFTQLKVLSVLTALVGICIFLIILRRLYERSFWLFRLVRRSNGTLIVPNAVTSFVAVESTFAILMIAFCWQVVAWYQNGRSSKHLILWIGLTWLPLILGAWCTTVGIIYARPDALSFVSPQPGKPPSRAVRMGITPAVVNIFFFAIPIVQSASVVVPAVLAQNHFSQAFEHYYRWAATLQPGESLTRELLLEAQQIWFRVLDAAYWISICMAIWEAWVCGLFFCYCMAGGSLIATLRKQLSTLKGLNQNRSVGHTSTRKDGIAAPAPTPARPLSAATLAITEPDQIDVDVEKQPVSPSVPGMLSVQPPPRSMSLSSTVSDAPTLVASDSGFAKPATGQILSVPHLLKDNVADEVEARTTSVYFTREEMEHSDQPSHTFFPPVRPSTFERPTQASTAAGKQSSQKRYLEKFYLNFLVQFIGLMLCILFFAIFCGKLITTWYSAWEANKFGPAFQTAILVVCWVTWVLASIIIFAILSRTYEPVLSNIGAAGANNSRRASLVLSITNHSNKGGSNKETSRQEQNGRRLSGARSWVATMSSLSSGENRQSHEIGLDTMRHSRAGSLAGVGRSSLHTYAELEPPSPKSRPLSFRKPVPTIPIPEVPTIAVQEPRRQRSLQSLRSKSSSNSKSGVMIEHTVSTIVEDPAVEEDYFFRHSIFNSGDLSTPGRLRSRSERDTSPKTASTLWSPSTTYSAKSPAGTDQSPVIEVPPTEEDWTLQLSQTYAPKRPARSRAREQSWSAPSVWGSGRPSPELVQEDVEMQLRMASRHH